MWVLGPYAGYQVLMGKTAVVEFGKCQKRRAGLATQGSERAERLLSGAETAKVAGNEKVGMASHMGSHKQQEHTEAETQNADV